MTSRPDRDSIKSLTYVNPSNNRNASGNTDVAKGFKNPPTVITTPSNRPGLNPFAANPNRRSQSTFGNLTSKGTLLSVASSRHDDRPTKRPRLDPRSFKQGNSSSSINARQIYDTRKPLLAPEPEFINVDDDDDEIEDTTPLRPSSDELNLPSSSKYFRRKAQQELETPKRTSIVDDGPATKWLKNYAVDDDDPIEQFSEKDPQQSSGGIVKREVKRINGILEVQEKPSPKWLDLSLKTRMKDKMRPKATKSAFSKATENPQIPDPLTTPTTFTSKNQKEGNCLPVIEAFVGDHYYPDSSRQTLQLCWSTNHKLVLKANDLEVWSLVMDTANCKQAQHSKEIPTFIVDPGDPTKLQVAIKFNLRHPQWDAKKYKEIQSGALGFKSREASNGDILWETVKRDRENSRASSKDVNGTAKLVGKEMNVPRVGEKRKNSERSRSNSPPVQIVEPPGEVGPSKFMPPTSKRSRRSIESGSGDFIRRSSRNVVPAKAAPPADQDEVILVYPQGSPGAVNVTNGDLARLEPGEFLNDTLIEFGLKLWLKDLEETRPDLAKQIHIFSSFFYKKLNGKKDVAQAFETVRKWTSKIDIFEKKYIIVPINENVHWYLAIIYEPEHILSPPAPQPTPKKQTRSSGKVAIFDVEEETMPTIKIPNVDTEEIEEDDPNMFGETAESTMTPSEAEVEKDLNTDFQSSCNIGDSNDDGLLNGGTDETRSSAGLSYVTEEGLSLSSPSSAISYLTEEGRAMSASALSHLTEDGGILPTSVVSHHLTEGHPPPPRTSSPVAVRSVHNEKKRRRASSRMSVDMMVEDSTEETEPSVPEPEPAPGSISAIAPNQFYNRTKNYKGKRKTNFDINPVVSTGSSGNVIEIHEAPKTYIFILDSLGTRHPQASKKLAKYLEMEAADKKGIDKPNSAQAKLASVPVQPNFCDCGVYLLHFARIFMNDPTRYCQSILSQKGKSIPNKDRQDVWEDHRVAEMREDIAKRIRELSSVWKQERVIKDRQFDANNKVNISDSDDEIDIVDSTLLKKKKNEGLANRPRG